MDLRLRIVAALDRGQGSQRAMAALFGVSLTCVKKLVRQRRERGSLAAKPHGGGPPRRVGEQKHQRVRGYLQRKPDATVDEVHRYLTRCLRLPISRATAGRVVQRLALPRKKNSGGARAR